MTKIVLTGGPSGGKTTMAMAIEKTFGQDVVMMPESASILFSGGFKRCFYAEGVKHQQRAIYRVQVEHEWIFEHENPHHIIICDRGTLDGWAYWPEDESDFFAHQNTTLEDEIQRYDWVIHLDTARRESYDRTNHLRHEEPAEADAINEKVKSCWKSHPQRFIIPSSESFTTKVTTTMAIVARILKNWSYEDIVKDVLAHE